jgi:hypothetical protein
MLFDKYGDSMLSDLLDIKAIGNLAKSFLKEPDVDDDSGEITRQNGLHYWLASDQRVHANMSCTETGRPRAWRPNVLNWPKFVNPRIVNGIMKVVDEDVKAGQLPEFMKGFIGLSPKEFPSIRSCVYASCIPKIEGSQGWCLVESDLDTAEVSSFLSLT